MCNLLQELLKGNLQKFVTVHEEIEMEVRLRAPLLTTKGYSIVVANHDNNTAIVMQDSASDENKRLLEKYLE